MSTLSYEIGVRRCCVIVMAISLGAVLHGDVVAQDIRNSNARTAAILTKFGTSWNHQNWKPGYMRPLDDVGWKLRMAALQKIVQQGPAARSSLVQALKNESAPVRALAAQALGYGASVAAQPALALAAEQDTDPMVRLYAADSLGMLGGRKYAPLLRQLQAGEKNRDVKRHLQYALDRQGQALSASVAPRFRKWSIENLGSAKLGKQAPDFDLASLEGQRVRLSDFRGKKAVVLVFIYGDT